jgi:hypothetical protein
VAYCGSSAQQQPPAEALDRGHRVDNSDLDDARHAARATQADDVLRKLRESGDLAPSLQSIPTRAVPKRLMLWSITLSARVIGSFARATIHKHGRRLATVVRAWQEQKQADRERARALSAEDRPGLENAFCPRPK